MGEVELCVRTLIVCFSSCFPAEILQANDKLIQALRQYRQVVASREDGAGGGPVTSSVDAPGKECSMTALFLLISVSGVWKGSASWKINVDKTL